MGVVSASDFTKEIVRGMPLGNWFLVSCTLYVDRSILATDGMCRAKNYGRNLVKISTAKQISYLFNILICFAAAKPATKYLHPT